MIHVVTPEDVEVVLCGGRAPDELEFGGVRRRQRMVKNVASTSGKGGWEGRENGVLREQFRKRDDPRQRNKGRSRRKDFGRVASVTLTWRGRNGVAVLG